MAEESAEGFGQLSASADCCAEIGGPNIEQGEREWLDKVPLQQRKRCLHHGLRLLLRWLRPLLQYRNTRRNNSLLGTCTILHKCGNFSGMLYRWVLWHREEVHTWTGIGMEVEERDQPCFLCLHFSVRLLGRRW